MYQQDINLAKEFFSVCFRNRFTDYFQPIFEEVFGPPRQRTGLSTLLSERIDLQMDQSAPPNPSGPAPTPTTEPSSSTGAVRSGTESGWITPEEVSNITSSDAATVHSSDSGILKYFVKFLTPLKFCCTVKFLNFGMPEIFAVIYLKFKQRGQT